VKKVLALTALSAALLVSFPALAADTAPASPPAVAANAVKPPSEMFEALAALGAELKAAVGTGKGNPIPYLDKLAAHAYSDATKAKLGKVFGKTEPLTITRGAADAGMVSYAIAAPAYSYTDVNATTTAWSGMNLNLLLDKDGRNMTSKGAWPSFSISDKDMGVTVSGMTFDGKQRRNERNIWLGKVNGNIGKIAITPAGKPGAVLENWAFTSSAVQRGNGVDLSYDSNLKAVKVGGEQLDDVRFAMRMTNMDMRMLEKLSDSLAQADSSGKTQAQQLAMVTEQFKAMGKSIATRGSSFEIEELSAGFRGNRAVIKGKVSLAPSTDADFASAAKMSKKVVVRLNVRVPVAFINDIAKAVIAQQAEAKQQPMTPDAIAQAAQSISDVVVGKLLNGSMAKLENGVLLSLIEFKAGKLTFNGKEVPLPTSAKPKQ
jgi:uncharacterized protein YdgA (DUF945 family)